MKRMLVFLLLVSLCCVGSAFASSTVPYVPLEDPGNLVADIPWGVSVEELLSLAKENLGLELVPGDQVEGLTSYYRTPEGENLTFLDEPCVSLRFLVNGVPENAVGEFYRVALVEYPLLEDISGEEAVTQAVHLLNLYDEHYGPMHHVEMQVGASYENTEIFFDFPLDEEGNPDLEALLFAAREIEAISILSCFQNLSVNTDILYSPEDDLFLVYSVVLFSQPTEENSRQEFHNLPSLGDFRAFYETEIAPQQ